MVLQEVVGSQAVFVFALLATAASASILNDVSPPPEATSNVAAAQGPPPAGNQQGEPSYQDGQYRKTYPYPTGRQLSTYTYSGGVPRQYGNENVDNSYQGAHEVPQYVSSPMAFTKMAAKPYTYYVAHPGEAVGATYPGSRTAISEPLGHDYSVIGDSQGVNAGMASVDHDSDPTETNAALGKRSLLEMMSRQLPAPAQTSVLTSLTSTDLLANARVELSVSGGYPSNTPRFTYLTFIIPGDLCTSPQSGSSQVTSGSQLDGYQLGNPGQMNGFLNRRQLSLHSNSYGTPPATEYVTLNSYQYPVTGQVQHEYGPTLYTSSAPVGRAFGVNGGELVGAGGPGFSAFQRVAAVRSLDSNQKTPGEPRSPPASSSGTASADTIPKATPTSPASRSLSV